MQPKTKLINKKIRILCSYCMGIFNFTIKILYPCKYTLLGFRARNFANKIIIIIINYYIYISKVIQSPMTTKRDILQ